VEVVRLDPGQMTMTTVWRRLTFDLGVRTLLCEGGPTVFGALLQEDLADELFLTLSPRLAGGGSEAAITYGPPLPELLQLRLRWALERQGSVFLRYAVSR
jgi:riboflavin biosynthesis pyrimidine reductase